ncbi:DUF11 domain-containing protein [Solihabitans fulvus]|uniref:DUF11 domain-containing protein n=1 Tax=Solihabitans fulvus TaxID=1892852 RepID=A0A5B2WNK6_9PSEU|nr:GEVED domain-containing protein [Solihabitans fulvus]KAA2252568.1 DUF11 domain-containing protein [Solihabitans fulvus]
MRVRPVRRFVAAVVAVLLGLSSFALVSSVAPPAEAYQTHPAGSWFGNTGTNTSASSTLPSGLQVTVAVANSLSIVRLSNNTAGSKGVVAGMYTPALPTSTPFIVLNTDPQGSGCFNSSQCGDFATLTVSFNRPVRNPVLHLTGIGAKLGAGNSQVQHRLTSSAPTGASLSAVASGATNLQVSGGNTIQVINKRSNTVCNSSTPGGSTAGCGSVPVNGTVSSLTFAVNQTGDGGAQITGDEYLLGVTADENFGDAPASYDAGTAASHIVSDLRMGARVDPNNTDVLNTGQVTPSPNAVAPGADITSAHTDGITKPLPRLATSDVGKTYSLTTSLSGASQAGRVCGWIDFNRNGVFDNPGERACADFAAGATSVTLSWTVPNTIVAGYTYARLRAGYDTTQVQSPTGLADSGEVEDYRLPIESVLFEKKADKSTANPGDKVTYTVTVNNNGPVDVSGVQFQDDLTKVLDDATWNNDAVARPAGGTITAAMPNLTWAGTVKAGQTITVTYSVTVKNPNTGDNQLVNGIRTNTGNCQTGSTDPKCTTTVNTPGMELNKTADKSSANPGDTVKYTVTVRNTGKTPLTNANFTDDLTNVIDDATVNTGSVTSSVGSATYTAPKLSWTGTLAVGATATVTYTVTVKNPVTGDFKLVNAVTSTTPGNNCPSGSTDPKCTTSTPISGLRIAKVPSKSSANPGDTVTYTVTVTNTGQTVQTNATFTDDLSKVVDDATFNNDQAINPSTAGVVSYTAPKLTWTGNLAVGASVTVTYSVTVHNPVTGDHKLTNTITSTTPGNNCVAGSTDPLCSTTTPISGIEITKVPSKTSANPGDTVTYTVTVRNTGQTTVTNATFTDDLSKVIDDATFNAGSITASPGTATYSAPKLTWTGTLAVGATATVTYSVTVNNPDTGDHKLDNVVTSTTPGSNCPTGSTDPKCTTSTPVSGLTIAKTSGKASANPGDTVTYTVTVTNTGQTVQTNATFTDDLSKVVDDATFNAGSITASAGAATYSAPKLTWTGTLAVGEAATITYTVTVNNPDTGDHKLDNVVTSTTPGNNCPTGSTDPKCTTSTPVSGMQITKVPNKSSANPGDTVQYTVTVKNTGQTPLSGATFTDDLSKVVDDATVNAGSITADKGAATYAAPKLTWTGDIPVGATATVTYTVTVNNPDTGDHKLDNVVTSTTPGNNCPTGSTDPKCATSTPVSGLRIVKSVDRTQVVPGDTLTYTVTVTNTGQTVQNGATFTDDLTQVIDDATFNTGSITASPGTATYAAPKLTWTGDLAVGAKATITYTVTVKNPDPGDKKLNNVVTSTTPGNNCPPGSTDPSCSTTTPGKEMTVKKTSDKATANPGDTVTYTVTVTNTGQVPLTGAQAASFTDNLSNVIDDATFTTGSITASVGTATYTAPNLAWTGDLAIGATATVTYSVRVNNPITGDHQLSNVVSTPVPGNCEPGSTNPDCSTKTPLPGMEIEKKADKASANPGDTVTYTVTVRNTGKTVLTGATFTDDLTNVIDDATFNAGSITASPGAATYSAPKLTWTGDLPLGATATITYTVTVNNPAAGDHKLANVVTSTTPGNNCPTGSTDPKCGTSTPVSGIEIRKAADKTDAKPGDKVTYTVTVHNTGQTVLTGATFTDDLTQVVDDATFNNDQSATIGTPTYAAPKLTWTGNLPVGATSTVTYSVTVNNPVKGDFKLTNVVTTTTPGGNCPVGSKDPKCGTTTPIAGLEITKVADKANAKPGDKVTYTVTVKNTGQTVQTGATFTDDLTKVIDDATFNSDESATIGTATYAAPKLTWLGDLPIGSTATVKYSVTVNNPVKGDFKLTNVVTSTTPGGNCPPGSTDPKCGTTTPIAGLEITKVTDKKDAKPGDKVTYTVTVKNTGQTVQTGATFTDDLTQVVDDATFNNDQSATIGTPTYTAPKLTWVGDLPIGSTATITYSVTVNNPVKGDFKLTNVVTSDTPGGNCPPGSTDPKCGTTTPIAGLEITKVADKKDAKPGDKVTYTVTVKNTGQTVQTGATFTDDLSKVIDDATFNNDQSATIGTPTYAAPKLTWLGDLPIGATSTVTYSVTVNNPVKGDFKLMNVVTSDTPGGNCPPGSTDPKCGTTTPIAGLEIHKVADKANAKPGDKVTYTVTVKNTGQTVQTGATFTDDLTQVVDDATFNNDQSATIGTPTYTAPKLTWVGDLPIGSTSTVTYSVTVNNPVKGDFKLTNVVTSDTPGGNCPPGSTDPKCGTTTPIAGLEIIKVADKTHAKPGDKVTYTVTVKNTGQTVQTGATFTDDLTKVIDDATFNNDQSATIGTPTYAAPKLTWVGDLPIGATSTVTYSVTVNNPVKGDFKLTNVVASDTPGGNCPPGSTDPKCGTTTPIAGLEITKVADKKDAKPGDKVTYTVTVKNTGQTVQTGATFTDDLTKVIDDATFDNDQSATIGTPTYTAPKLTWVGDLPIGATATVTYSVTVNNPIKGDFTLLNAVTSDTPGGNCPPGSTDPKCGTTTPIAGLEITKIADKKDAKPGDKVTYTVTVKNTGQTVQTGATFTDDLTKVVDDATFNNDQSATIGTPTYAAPKLTWVGNLPIGATATVTYSVTVNNPVKGDFKLTNVVTSDTPGGNCPPGSTDPKCGTTTPIAGLEIDKVVDKQDAKPGDKVTYTVTVKNTGQTVQTGATFTDDLTKVIDDATFDNDQSATIGTPTYAAPKLTWVGDLPIGAMATVTYSVTVSNPVKGDFKLTNVVTSDTPGNNCPPGSTDPKCGKTTPIAGLEITKTAGRDGAKPTDPLKPGDTVKYTVTVKNTGQTVQTGATFTDDLTKVLDDAKFNNDQAATIGAKPTYTAPYLTWTGDLPIGATATITYSVKVNNPITGDHKLINAITSDTPGGNCPPGSTDPKCSTVTPLPGMTIQKKADTTQAKPGDKVTYTITVTNSGQTELTGATFTDDMTQVIDDAKYNADAKATTGATTYTAPKLTWTGDLAIGATATVTYTVTVNDPPTGDKKLGNVVTSTTPGNNCPVPMPTRLDSAADRLDPRCSTTVLVPRLDIVKKADKADTKPGDKVTYTVTATNSGQTVLTAATFTDDLTGVLPNAAYNADAKATIGSTTYTAPKLTWTGDLAIGASVTVTYSVTVKENPAGTFQLRNAVGSTTPGASCPPGSTDPKCTTTTPIAGVAIEKTSDSKQAGPGDLVTYKVTVRNTGQTVVKDATFTDDLTGVLDNAAYNADAKATIGSTTYTAPKLTWTGDLPVGATATVTYSVKVNDSVGGDRALRNAVLSTTPGNNCPPGSADPRCATTTPLQPSPEPVVAFTGAVVYPVLLGGLALLMAGGLFVLGARRRGSRR